MKKILLKPWLKPVMLYLVIPAAEEFVKRTDNPYDDQFIAGLKQIMETL